MTLVYEEINNSHTDTLFKAGTQRGPGSVEDTKDNRLYHSNTLLTEC